jgi:hypothetical protein
MGMMRSKFKVALFILSLLFMLMAIFSSFFPDEVMTSKWVMIAGQKEVVQKKIEDLNTWESWNLLLRSASPVTISKSKDSLTAGDKINWNTNAGSQNEILFTEKTVDGIAMEIKLVDEKPIQSGFSIAQRKDSVQVVWFIVEKLAWYPWEKIYGMMASDIKGPALQQSLDNLKKEF